MFMIHSGPLSERVRGEWTTVALFMSEDQHMMLHLTTHPATVRGHDAHHLSWKENPHVRMKSALLWAV